MNTLDEMRHLDLLSAAQHQEIAAWLRAHKTPAGILAMPPHLWRVVEAASVAMSLDADFTRPPALDADLA